MGESWRARRRDPGRRWHARGPSAVVGRCAEPRAGLRGGGVGPAAGNGTPMIAQAVACHLGVAILPRFLVEDQIASGTIVQLFNQSIRSKSSYYLVVPDAKASSSPVSAFAKWILTEAKPE